MRYFSKLFIVAAIIATMWLQVSDAKAVFCPLGSEPGKFLVFKKHNCDNIFQNFQIPLTDTNGKCVSIFAGLA